MLIIRGVNLYPSQVEHVLLSVDGAAPHYRLIVDAPGADGRDHARVRGRDGRPDREALRRRDRAACCASETGLRIDRRRAGAGRPCRAARARRCGCVDRRSSPA